jgi:hypothetical protein
LDIVAIVPLPAIDPGLMTQVPVAGRPVRTTVPVGTAHDAGCVIVPTVGAGGAGGAGLIATSAVAMEVHPVSVVTVKLYVPPVRPAIVVVVPDPVTAPGLIVHVPVAGRSFSITLPVASTQATGCVIVPTVGAAGIPGGVSIMTVDDATEVHPDTTVTVKL